MMPASMDASIAASPSVAPTVRCSMTSTGTGSAPPLMRTARSSAWAWVKLPVMLVLLPPPERHKSGWTAGEEMMSSSSRMATRLPPSVLAQAAATRSRQPVRPSPAKLTFTTHWPTPCCGVAASASETPSPSTSVGPRSSGWPCSSFATTWPSSGSWPSCAGRRTSWKESWAVWPMTSAASRGSVTPGSSTMIRRSPDWARVGSATPRASTRPRMTSRAREVDSASALTRSVSWVSRTICVPPSRSRPRLAGLK